MMPSPTVVTTPRVVARLKDLPMRTALAATLLSRALLVLAAVAAGAPGRAADPQPPKGFTALFNGKDLTGWHGMPHFDPYKLAAMPEAERQAKVAEWTAE